MRQIGAGSVACSAAKGALPGVQIISLEAAQNVLQKRRFCQGKFAPSAYNARTEVVDDEKSICRAAALL